MLAIEQEADKTSGDSELNYLSSSLLRTLINSKRVSDIEIDVIQRAVLRRLGDRLGVQAVALYFPGKTPSRIVLRRLYFSGLSHRGDMQRRQLFSRRVSQIENLVLPIDEPFAGQALRSGQTQRGEGSQIYCPVEWSPEFPLRSVMAVPLKGERETLGCLEVINKGVNGSSTPFSDRDAEVVAFVARYLSILIDSRDREGVRVSAVERAKIFAHMAGAPYKEIEPNDISTELLKTVGSKTISRYFVLPLRRLGEKQIAAAVVDPLNKNQIQDFEIVTGLGVTEFTVTTPQCIEAVLQTLDESASVAEMAKNVTTTDDDVLHADEEGEAESENSKPIIELANRLIEDAVKVGASDIHIEPQQSEVIIRYRVDGICQPKSALPKRVLRALVSRIKIMCDLDIAERRLPQDGRLVFRKFNSRHDVDLRVSTAPSVNGETVVMRLLDRKKSHLPLPSLGFSAYNLRLYMDAIRAPYGMILHTGPTGSGKSMTLFAALNEINRTDVKIVTVEDPVEYTLPGIIQVQVHKEIDLTFASALRCFLRQDPDVILVGEIRDRETAEIATEAALTGHLLFSTLHTNDASSAITRLSEMDIEPFVLSSTLVCVCAQRLVRKLCTCKVEADLSSEEKALIARAKDGAEIGKVYSIGHCEACGQAGYKGRTGVHELLVVNEAMRHLIATGSTAEQIKTLARQGGMRTLFEDAMEKVKLGITSLGEALANVSSNESA